MDGRALIYYVETGIYFLLALVALALEVWAFFDCLRHKANAFEAVSKRTKTFWLAVTGGLHYYKRWKHQRRRTR